VRVKEEVAVKITFVAILAIVLFSTSVNSETPSKMAGAPGDVLAAAEAIVNAFGHNDREAYFALFDPAATFIFYTTPYRLNDRAAYEKEWSKWDKESGFRVRSCSSSDQKVHGNARPLSFTASTDACRASSVTLLANLFVMFCFRE
jgi:hypothetical protein